MKIKITDIENVKVLPDKLKATGISKKKEKAAIAKKISIPKRKKPAKKMSIPIVEIPARVVKTLTKPKKVVAKVTKPVTVKAKVVAKVKKAITKGNKRGKKNRGKNL